MSSEMKNFILWYAKYRRRGRCGRTDAYRTLDHMESYAFGCGVTLDLSSDDEQEASSYTNTSPTHKKPRQDDGRIISAYKKVKYAEFLYSMHFGRKRVHSLLSQSKVPCLNEKLKEMEAHFEDLFLSVERRLDDSAEDQKRRLVELAKQILIDWELIDNQIEQSKLFGVSPRDVEYCNFFRCAIPSAWLFENGWRDMAYEEVVSLRNKHSCLLDKVYHDGYKGCFERKDITGWLASSYKKRLNFLGCSREDIGFLSIKKCYKRVMSIKQFVIDKELGNDQLLIIDELRKRSIARGERVTKPSLGFYESWNNQTQQPNWRDEIYDEIRAIRKMYSDELDKAFRELNSMDAVLKLDKNHKACIGFFRETLTFLATSRARIVFLSEEHCRQQVDGIKRFLRNAKDCVPAKQYAELLKSAGQPRCQFWLGNGPTNWRDLAYQQLQDKADRFRYRVYDSFLLCRGICSQMYDFYGKLKRLEVHLQRALYFYQLPRTEISLIECKDDYFNLVNMVTVDILESASLVEDMRVRIGLGRRDWRPNLLLPRRNRLSCLE